MLLINCLLIVSNIQFLLEHIFNRIKYTDGKKWEITFGQEKSEKFE